MKAESLIVLSGVSGSGKSTALNALEDLGFYCVDNLPPPLIGKFAEYLVALPDAGGKPPARDDFGHPQWSKHFALLLNCYEAEDIPSVLLAFNRLRSEGVQVRLLFFDCQDEIILRRYKETRRSHPLLGNRPEGKSIAEALAEERRLLAEFRGAALRTFDTSSYSPHELRRAIADYIGENFELEVTFQSFSYRFGIPADTDLVLDVRFLPNPHFDPKLKDRTGIDPEVAKFVFQGTDGEELVRHYTALLRFLLPRYKAEGKRYLNVSVGCTGGKHRSVAVVERLRKELEGLEIRLVARHRDKDR